MEFYEEAQDQLVAEDDEAADDRIAEQFRREFLDAIQSRHHRRSAANASAAKGRAVETKSSGPKLGGSRSARAAMRAMEEKNTKKR